MKVARLYGTVTFYGGRWAIQCEPQVAVRIKRVFAKIAKSEHGVIFLADTPENCRELQWFLQRYPMKVDPEGRLGLGATEHRKKEADVAAILSDGYKPGVYELAVPAREYQRVATDLFLKRGSLLLADEVGLGKTAVGICGLVAPDALPALVVTLAHLPRQWEAEIKRFAPGIRVHRLRTGQPYDLTKFRRKTVPHPDVLISSYHKLTGWADQLAGKMRTVIFDEAAELRHQGTLKYDAAKFIAEKADRRAGLSATPIYNYGGEIFSVMNVLAPGELGSAEEFRREWCNVQAGYGGGDKLIIKDPKALGYYLREQGLMLRRTRADVSRELPMLTKVPHYIDAELDEIEKVASSAADLARLILRQGGKGFEKMRAAEELDWRLRQATGIAKAPYVADFVRMLVESGEPVVLYGWHREVYGLWMKSLADLKPVLYTGSESPVEKERSKQAFVSGETNVLIISLRSGAGLDGLQHRGRTVVFGELDWSPSTHHQCIGRVHRDGQVDPVIAYYLIAEHGSDPSIVDALGLKKQQSDGINDPKLDLSKDAVMPKVDLDRVKKLAASFLEQRNRKRTVEAPAGEEAA